MKKAIFCIVVLLLSLGFVGVSLGQKAAPQPPDTIDEQIFPRDVAYVLADGKLTEKNEQSRIRASRLGEGDLVFFSADSEAPKIARVKDTEEISVGKGLYLISTFDAYQNYSVKHDEFTISQVSNGVYFIDTRDGIRLYSMSALIRVQLLNAGKASTQIEVFPSEYLVYDPAMAEKLIQADVFRVGQLATLSIADPFSGAGFARIFGNNVEDVRTLFDEYQKYYQNRQAEIQKVLTKFKPLASGGLTKLDEFGMLFVNNLKKKAILENSLVSLLQTMVLLESDTCNFCKDKAITPTQVSGQIQERLRGLAAISPEAQDGARALVRKYLTFGSSVNTSHTSEYYGIGGSILTSVYQSTFSGGGSKDQKVYKLLTDIYSQYFFGSKDQADLQKNLASYVTYLVNSKSMGEREFLGFTYFLKEFLNSQGTSDDSNVRLFSQLMSIAEKYIDSLGTEREKTNMLSIFYFTFNSISDRLESGIQSRFFTGDADSLKLKPEYLVASQSNIPSDAVSAVDGLIQNQKLFLSKYQAMYLMALGDSADSSVNYFTQLTNSHTKLANLLGIMKNYEDYADQLKLSEDSKNATGLVIDAKPLSLDDLTKYLSAFTGVDVSTLSVSNDYVHDRYYQVSVSIFGKPFQFKLYGQGNRITEVVFHEADGTENRRYEQTDIVLDNRSKDLQDAISRANTAEERARYELKNFFKVTFFPNEETSGPATNNPGDNAGPTLSTSMQIFVQRELIEKDFAIVSRFLPISIRNVQADIVNGNYVISLSQLGATVNSANGTYKLKIKSDYVFQSDAHAFENFRFTVTTGESRPLFGGSEITLAPNRIDTVDLENQFKKIGPLLELAARKDPTGTNIRLDLSTNSVIISGVTYTE